LPPRTGLLWTSGVFTWEHQQEGVFRTPNAPFVRVVDPRSIFSGASTLASLPEGCMSFLAAGVCSRSALPVHSRGWGGGSTCVPGVFRTPNATFVTGVGPDWCFSFTSKCRVTREGSSTVMPLSGTPTVGELDSPVRARLP